MSYAIPLAWVLPGKCLLGSPCSFVSKILLGCPVRVVDCHVGFTALSVARSESGYKVEIQLPELTLIAKALMHVVRLKYPTPPEILAMARPPWLQCTRTRRWR